jgi:uncharacterized protein (TIGR04206 family)
MASVLNGAAAMACVAVGTYFARFWHETGDRLFWCLAAAFLLFAVNYAAIGVLPLEDERGEYAFVLRLVGFAAILVGVLLKDRELADHLTSDIRDDAF